MQSGKTKDHCIQATQSNKNFYRKIIWIYKITVIFLLRV